MTGSADPAHQPSVFGVHRTTVSAAFQGPVSVLFSGLSPMVHWPDRDNFSPQYWQDRGLSVGMMLAEVTIPALTKGHHQLDAKDVEETKCIAHLRIHME